MLALNEDTLIKFTDMFIKPSINSALLELDQFLIDNLHSVKQVFIQQMDQVFKKCEGYTNIAYLVITLSWINITQLNYTYKVWLYGRNWYLDELGVPAVFDAAPIYNYIVKATERLLAESKKYLALCQQEIVREIYRYIPDFNFYVARMMQLCSGEIMELESYINLGKDTEFRIYVAELYEQPEIILNDHSQPLKKGRILKLLDERDRLTCKSEDFRHANLQDYNGNHLILINTGLQQSNMKNIKLQDSLLYAVRCNNADLTEADISRSSIIGCNFEGAVLKNAKFESTAIMIGQTFAEKGIWQKNFRPPTSFRYANLQGADFSNAKIYGADFSGADLENMKKDNAQFINCIGI